MSYDEVTPDWVVDPVEREAFGGQYLRPSLIHLPEEFIAERECSYCGAFFDPHIYPSPICYRCDERVLSGPPRTRTVGPPPRVRTAKGKSMKYDDFAQWGRPNPVMDAVQAMDRRLDILQEALTKELTKTRSERKELTERVEQAEQHPEIVAANTLAEEMEKSRQFEADRVERARQLHRRELEEAVQVVVYLVCSLAGALGTYALWGIGIGLLALALFLAVSFFCWADNRKAADRREDALATLVENRKRS